MAPFAVLRPTLEHGDPLLLYRLPIDDEISYPPFAREQANLFSQVAAMGSGYRPELRSSAGFARGKALDLGPLQTKGSQPVHLLEQVLGGLRLIVLAPGQESCHRFGLRCRPEFDLGD